MRVALIHEWLTAMRGGERCLEVLLDIFPEAEIFTLLHVPGAVSQRIEERPIHTSFIGSLPRASDYYRYYLPLFPAAIERFDLRGFDLVISVSHCVAKGVRLPSETHHLTYCLTPMRYIWDLYDTYFAADRVSPWTRAVMPHLARRLRRWDISSSERPNGILACSRYVARRIDRYYKRQAPVVYPPVAVERFSPAAIRDDFYLVLSALVPYKRVDLVVESFNRLNRRLIIIGDGPELPRLRGVAGPNITFLGWLDDAEVANWLARCRAFVFSAEDDFGITVVEAQAAGAPVIAYAAGGAMETVIEAESEGDAATGASTGVFFHEQTPESLIAAVRRFESRVFDVRALQENARRFGAEEFRQGIRKQLACMLAGRASGGAGPHEYAISSP